MPFEQITSPRAPKPVNDLNAYRIYDLDGYETATERAKALADFPEGTPEAEELAATIKAIMDWDRSRDDATAPQ